jgi:clan AA aspartic protease (TIGR02281 family)
MLLAASVLNGCSDFFPAQRIAAEVAVPVESQEGEAQYAIATQYGRVGRIVVPVTINGQPNFHMMLDTGATHSVLTPKAAARLGLDLSQATVTEVQGVSGRLNAPVMKVSQLQAGSLKLQDLSMPIIDGAVVSGLDGILGVDGMTGKVISADFVRDRIRIADGSTLPANVLYAVIKFVLVSNRLVVVDGLVGRVPVRAVIDTGGTQTLGNLPLLQALTKLHKDQRGVDSSVIDIADQSQNGRLILVPDIRIGAATITNAPILFSDFTVFNIWHLDKRPTLLIGMDVLGQLGELSINYRRQELQVRAR